MAMSFAAQSSRLSTARPASRSAPVSRCTVRVQAARQWPDASFVSEVSRAFPAKGVATVEEARCLLDMGYAYVDVRSAAEVEDQGKPRVSVNVPFANAKPVYNSATKQRELQKTPNPDFVKQFKSKFPKTDHKILIACTNGKDYSIDALMALESAGYTNLAGLKGGYASFSKSFDATLKRKAGALVGARA